MVYMKTNELWQINSLRYKMDTYCVKERWLTPNVEGTEKLVMTKNNRKMLKVKCASRGFLGDVAMTVGDFAIREGVPFLGIRA